MANLFAQLSSVPVRLDMIMIKRHFKAFKMVIRFLNIYCQGLFKRDENLFWLIIYEVRSQNKGTFYQGTEYASSDCFVFLSVYLYLFLYLCSANNIRFCALLMVSQIILGFENGSVFDWSRDTTTLIIN